MFKRFFAVIFTVLILLSVFSCVSFNAAATSGKTGGCKWEYNKSKNLLTISKDGSGKMADYSNYYDDDSDYPPWEDIIEDTAEDPADVVVKSGVTYIGAYSMGYAKTISLPDTVEKIGNYAFFESGVEKIKLPASLKEIGAYTFYNSCLESVTLPKNIKKIGDSAFEGTCLDSIILPDGLESIGKRAFIDNYLNDIRIPKSVKTIGDNAFGYYINSDDNSLEPNLDCTIKGYKETEAEKYAQENKFIFYDIDSDLFINYSDDEDENDDDEYNNENNEETNNDNNDDDEYNNENNEDINNDNNDDDDDNNDNDDNNSGNNYDESEYEENLRTPEPPEEDDRDEIYDKSPVNTSAKSCHNITLNKYNLNLYSGKSTFLKATTDVKKVVLKWKSSSPKVASVDFTGKVTAHKAGKATIYACSERDESCYCKCKVTVKQSANKIKLSKTVVNMPTNGSKIKLKATVYPKNAYDKELVWSSSDKKVATVNSNGEVNILKKGNSVIICKSKKGDAYAYCAITGGSKAKSVKLNCTGKTLNESKSFKLKASVKGSGLKKVAFTSSNSSIAKVTADGKVKALKNGTAVITAKTLDGSKKSAKCTVKVKNHKFSAWTKVKDGTCKSKAKYSRICKCCGKVESKKKSFGKHIYNKVTVLKEATCTECGEVILTCGICKKAKKNITTYPKGHDWRDNYELDSEATCYTAGIKSIHCRYCEAVKDKQEIPQRKHHFNKIVEEKPETCTEYGLITRTCEYCGFEKTSAIEPHGHLWEDEKKVDFEPSCIVSGMKSIHCKRCDETKDIEIILPTGHSFYESEITQKASQTHNGSVFEECENCGSAQQLTISMIASVKLNQNKLIYNGKVQKPTFIIKDADGEKLEEREDYTVTYSAGCKNAGEYKATAKFKGKYEGSASLSFTIVPPTPVLKNLTAEKAGFRAAWAKNSAQTTGYQVKYSLKSDMSGAKTKSVSGIATVSAAISGLKTKTTYYVQVRAYKTVKVDGNEKTIYSNYSSKKKITTKS